MTKRSSTVVLTILVALLFGASSFGVASQEHVVPFAHLFEVTP